MDRPTRDSCAQPGLSVIGTSVWGIAASGLSPTSDADLNKIRPFWCCTACIVVIDAENIDHFWSTYARSQRYRMSTLEEITKEKQRVGEALARVDAQREQLVSQLRELEATERVLARYTKGPQGRKTSSAKMPTKVTPPAAPARLRGRRRTTTAIPAGGRR